MVQRPGTGIEKGGGGHGRLDEKIKGMEVKSKNDLVLIIGWLHALYTSNRRTLKRQVICSTGNKKKNERKRIFVLRWSQKYTLLDPVRISIYFHFFIHICFFFSYQSLLANCFHRSFIEPVPNVTSSRFQTYMIWMISWVGGGLYPFCSICCTSKVILAYYLSMHC